MPDAPWTLKNNADPLAALKREDWLVMRGADVLGRIYGGAGPRGQDWFWAVQVIVNDDYRSGVEPDLASAKAAFRKAVEGLIRDHGEEAFERAVAGRRPRSVREGKR